MRVGTMVISEGLSNRMSQEIIIVEHKMTYRAIRSCLGILDFLLLMTKGEALTRPPRSLENKDKLSRTLVMASFHSAAPGLSVGRSSSGLMIFSLMKMRSSGGVGTHRIRIPRGIDTKPRASEIPHSRPGMGVTPNAAPPTNTIRI